MKKILNYSLVVLLLLGTTSCEKDLDELNQNVTNPTSIDMAFQLNNAIINLSFPTATLAYEIGIVQQIISPNSGVLAGANFNQDNRSVGGPIWQTYYRNVIRNTNDIISNPKTATTRPNLLQMARILQAYAYMVITDTYGEIPYTEAGKGYTDLVFYPKYDTQQSIYTDIIKELTEASAALNASAVAEPGEILFAGNIAQWKKFGYSLLLRAGMRLSKADATKAQAAVQAAFAGGVIIANTDNAFMKHDANYLNPIGNTLNGTEGANYYLTKPFVDYLKSTSDPRLVAIAVRYVGAKSGPEQIGDPTKPGFNASSDPTKQIGMPMGKDNGTIAAAVAADGLASFYDYTQVDRKRLTKTSSPNFFVTAGQTNLLLAEARLRGWITTGTDQGYYNAGVTANMNQMASYDAAATIPASEITAYLGLNPYSSATALQQINTQYWIASFLNGPEAFANFRRTGFPALAPNPYPGDIPAGTFIRRITYPTSELSVNTTNVSAAIGRQGADKMETKVWWDK